MRRSVFILAGLLLPLSAFAQTTRPRPYPVMPGPRFDAAIQAGTRTESGMPGPGYWTNSADYSIEATLSPDTRMVRGTETVTYHNNSPNDLSMVVVHLRQNLNAPGVVRNRPQKLTGGIEVSTVRVEGKDMVERTFSRAAGYRIDGTRMTIRLAEPIPAGSAMEFDFGWSFEVPEAGAPRIGTDGEMFFVGYWYPQFAVYDDVEGWVADPYMGNGEFYMDYGTYDVALTVPEGFIIGATGTLQNPEEVLSDQTRSRLGEAALGDEVVHVVAEEDREAGTSTKDSPTGSLTWRFAADNVRDFAFATSDKYLWDATNARVGGDSRSMIHAFYRPEQTAWVRAAEFEKFTIEYLSEHIKAYPWPHMSVVEGVVGGMEFPMITHISGRSSERSLFGTTFHETAHMWFPMMVGHNEKAFTWMDEGLTSFNTSEGSAEFWDADSWNPRAQGYYRIAGTGDEVEPMRHGDRYPLDTAARTTASYNKPAVALNALRGIIGNDQFYEAYQEYARRWSFKHPYPYDFFNTFNDVLGQDLDWFWTTMFFETWTLDQAVSGVSSDASGVTVRIDDLGLSPFPSPVRVTYADGSTREDRVPVETWLNGARRAELHFPAGNVTRVEIDPDTYLPDIERSNNVWPEQ